MSEIHYVERSPRRSDFCGCPPCPICYDPVIIDGEKAPTFQEVMSDIYGEGPMPQTEQEYEWAHVAAHQCRKELEQRADGEFFQEQDRVKMTQIQIDDLLRRAKKAAEAPKPLNTVNLDDMPVEAVSRKQEEDQQKAQKRYDYAMSDYLNSQMTRETDQQIMKWASSAAGYTPR